MNECSGVQCKHEECKAMIALGRTPSGSATQITFQFMPPRNISCPLCRREYEYTQADLVRFPCPEGQA
jgi:hypothetical protein